MSRPPARRHEHPLASDQRSTCPPCRTEPALTPDSRNRITPRFIQLAIRNDDELDRLIGPKTTISQGGVIPLIHPQLLPKQKNRGAMAAAAGAGASQESGSASQ